MKFAIDIAFVRRNGQVAKVRANVRPWRIAACFSAYAVIELPAGTLERTGTVRGHTLEVQFVEPEAINCASASARPPV